MTGEKILRSPLCAVVGHVDHGKSSILDNIRSSDIVSTEAGAITQAIGASIISLEIIKKKCGKLLESLNMKFTIPGLLFIDTPGHAAFTNLRKRGGNLADIAILVVDINEGFKPQTIEAVEILKSYKTPFIVALNKIDLTAGWRSTKEPILKSIEQQADSTKTAFERKLYEVVGQFHENFALNAERFDRVDDYTKQIALIPCSAKTGEGIPELLMVLTGLAQRFLENNLQIDVKDDSKGTVLEVKEERGIGTCLDVIIYDGTLQVNDNIVIGGMHEPIVTKVRALFQPDPLAEMRDLKTKFKSVKQATAATGVKIAAPDLKGVVAGMPIRSCAKDKCNQVAEEIQQEVDEVVMETDQEGIIIKADSLGSLEALSVLLREEGFTVRKATVGNITKKDLIDAESNAEKDPLTSIILGFNVDFEQGLSSDNVKVIFSGIIYDLIDKLKEWQEKEKKRLEAGKLDEVIRPCKIELMKGYVFRQSNPAVLGCDVLLGTAKAGMPLMNNLGEQVTRIKSIQLEKENVQKVERGKQAAFALEGVTVGRKVNEGDILYSFMGESDFRKLKDLKDLLTPDEKTAAKEIAQIMRENNPVWGV